MPLYRARFTAAGGAGGVEVVVANIPRTMLLVSVRAGGVDAAGNVINNAAMSVDITVDGTERVTDAATNVSTFAGDGRQLIPLSEPLRVSNSIATTLTNNGPAGALGFFDLVFECVDFEAPRR